MRPEVATVDGEDPSTPAPPPPVAELPELGPPARPNSPTGALTWQDCTPQLHAELGPESAGLQFQCGRLRARLSPGSYSYTRANLSVLSTGTGQIPLVVVGDVAGTRGTRLAAQLASSLPASMLSTFRIIGVDRRGTGLSLPADCIPAQERQALTSFDPRATDRASVDRLTATVQTASRNCLIEMEDEVPSMDTFHASGDLEQLRRELGVPRLHALGVGEGSRVLATFTERYPRSVGRMVFDGAPDPRLEHVQLTEHQARGAEATFDAFTQHCQSQGNCPLGTDPRGMVTSLLERTRHAPLPGSMVTAGTITRAMLLGLAERSDWPRLATALAQANAGNSQAIAEFSAPLTLPGAAQLDADMITSCNDTAVRVPPQRASDLAATWVGQFPLFGGVFAQRLVWCATWPAPMETPLPPRAAGLPPIPVVATAHDPITPESGTRAMAEDLRAGVRLNYQGAGHGAVGQSPCVTEAITRFYVDGRVPTEGTACPA